MLAYVFWFKAQPENWPTVETYYKEGKAPRLKGKWLPGQRE